MRGITRAAVIISLFWAAPLPAEPVTVSFTREDALKASLRWIDVRPGVTRIPALPVVPVPGWLPPPEKAASLEHWPSVRAGASAIGRLWFVDTDGQPRACTASLIGKGSILVTAARCIVDRTGQLNRDFVFVTAYGSVAQQLYTISCVAYPAEWVASQDPAAWRYNYAFLRTRRSATYGGLGVTNALPPKKLGRVGYADAVEEGARMHESGSGAYMTRDGMIGSVNDELAAGSSGNPWIRNSIVHSLSSHYDPERPELLLGPRFTGDTMQLLNHVRANCSQDLK